MIKNDTPVVIVKPKILIVDDYEDNLFTLSKLLKSLDVDVYQATSGESAMIFARRSWMCKCPA
jgi:CheY-like chemotaxis protein